jgi:hypothetical protein
MEPADEEVLLSPEEFMGVTKRIDDVVAPLLADLTILLSRLEQRLSEEDTHDCPTDHQVYEALEQSKHRMAESLMWLRTAIATKAGSESILELPYVHHEGDEPN